VLVIVSAAAFSAAAIVSAALFFFLHSSFGWWFSTPIAMGSYRQTRCLQETLESIQRILIKVDRYNGLAILGHLETSFLWLSIERNSAWSIQRYD
jgi:hypothetical protein